MKRSSWVAGGMFLCLVVALCLSSPAAAQDAEFKVIKIANECSTKGPGAAEFVNAKEGESYAYGSQLKTGPKSSAVIVLAEGSECTVLAEALLTVTQDVRDKKLKRIKLDEGKVDVSIDRGSCTLEVETPVAICGAVGTKFQAAAKSDAETNLGAFSCDQGIIQVVGRYFRAKKMGANSRLSVLCSNDRSLIRLKNMGGNFDIEIGGPGVRYRTVKMKPDMVIRILIKKAVAEDKFLITVLIYEQEGKEPSDSYTFEIGGGEEPPPPPDDDTDVLKKPVIPGTTTSTTTIPSPTPVGQL